MRQPSYAVDFARELNAFVAAENRAALAALRRAAGKPIGEISDPYRYLGPWLASGNSRREEACYLVASLFATHQISWFPAGERADRTNLGASFGRMAPPNDDARPSADRRFVALLNAHAEDFPVHLRHAVALLKSKDIAIDWARLVIDVESWGYPDRRVQRAWARAFWGEAGPEGDVPDANDPTEAKVPATPESDS